MKIQKVIMACCAMLLVMGWSSSKGYAESKKLDFSAKEKYDVHEISFSLNFSYDGHNTLVYEKPEADTVMYTVQAGDILTVTKAIMVKQTETLFIEVILPDETVGYVQLHDNPWKNGNYDKIETLTVDGTEVTVLKINEFFCLNTRKSLKVLPSDTADDVCDLAQAKDVYNGEAITSDYGWILVNVNGTRGWIRKEDVYVDRGGPVIHTPEKTIKFDLIDSNEI